LRRHPEDRRRVVTTTEGGLPCLTRFECVAEVDLAGCRVALMRCCLVTGRMHQIRVHMAASGWPIVGDAKYGAPRWALSSDPESRARLQGFPRQALHARLLSFVHPFTRERVEVEAPLPDDMHGLLTGCGLSATSADLKVRGYGRV
jgi:23S rRNA pseudouridine1911/1915/1917 synthase